MYLLTKAEMVTAVRKLANAIPHIFRVILFIEKLINIAMN